MANKKITALPAATTITLSDLLALVHDPSGSPVTQKMTLTQLGATIAGLFVAANQGTGVNLIAQSGADPNALYIQDAGQESLLRIQTDGGGGFDIFLHDIWLFAIANDGSMTFEQTVAFPSGALVKSFASAQTSFSATTQFTFAHGLGSLPKSFRCVMVNQSTDLGYTAGMEVDIRCVFHTSSGTEWSSVYADATNVYVSFREGAPAAANTRLVQAAGGVAVTGPDLTKWKFKVYALV